MRFVISENTKYLGDIVAAFPIPPPPIDEIVNTKRYKHILYLPQYSLANVYILLYSTATET